LLDDGHKTYKKAEIKLSVKVIYSGTKKEGGWGWRGTYSAKLASFALDKNHREAEDCLLSFL